MLEKPDARDSAIKECLVSEYGLNIVQVDFLPLGADRDTAVNRALADSGNPFFVKLRRGWFNEMASMVPRLLRDQGVEQIISPLMTPSQELWVKLGDFTLTVSPFIEGVDSFEVNLTTPQWYELGRALKAIHTTAIPQALHARLPQDEHSDQWRESVRTFQELIQKRTHSDEVAADLARLLQSKRDEITHIVRRSETLASVLQTRPRPFVLCHGDIHAWNILIAADGSFYIEDWDTLVLAPKERDRKRCYLKTTNRD